ncbi:hypothetical protein BJX99DRAFT_262488 [Aspergillus californicus]
MHPILSFLLPLSLLILTIPRTTAWSFTWTNSDGNAYVVHQSTPLACEAIEQAEGQQFRWHPEEDGLSFWIFENDDCEGYRAGYSPAVIWERVASRDLASFRVASEDGDGEGSTGNSTESLTESSTTSTTTAAGGGTSTGESTSTSTPTGSSTGISPSATPNAGSDSSNDVESSDSVPAGAVAGGVVGGIAGIAVIGGLFFFLGRRRRSSSSDSAAPEAGHGDSPPSSGHGPSTTPPAALSHGSTTSGIAPYDPSFLNFVVGRPELDSAAVYEASPVYVDELTKKPVPVSATDLHQPPGRMLAELAGSEVLPEMSDSHRVNELEGGIGSEKR